MRGYQSFEGRVTGVFGKALRFQGYFWHWAEMIFPQSQVIITDLEDDGSAILHVREWLCKKRDLVEFTEYRPEEITEKDAL